MLSVKESVLKKRIYSDLLQLAAMSAPKKDQPLLV